MSKYSVPQETQRVFLDGILNDPLIAPTLPEKAKEYAAQVSFVGSDAPSLPINWRFAESIASLKGLESIMINALLDKKYKSGPVKVEIDTDHAQLFIMSSLLWTIDPSGENLSASSLVSEEGRQKLVKYFPSWDKYGANNGPYNTAATNIYKTKDGKFFHIHASMNAGPTIESVQLPPTNPEVTTNEQAWKVFGDAVGKHTAEEMQDIATNQYRQAGTICYSKEEFKQSEHGKANAHVGLFEVHEHPNQNQKACWWPENRTLPSSPKRPLAGLKVIDLTRVIAGPAISRGLAEMGASVIRVIGPELVDLSPLHPDLNHGKWNTLLDLKNEDDRKKLRELVLEADVFLQGYRPHVLDKYGFGEKDILDICKERERGIIYARENCYGWSGPWKDRSGWQQISDANCGVSLEFGRAMGHDEPVTPVFPNSDYCTGVCGVAGILAAVLKRAEIGGSFTVDIALNYYSRWLVENVGVYPSDVWQELWQRNGSLVFRHYHGMTFMLPKVFGQVFKNSAGVLLKPSHFTEYPVKHMGGKVIKYPGPVIRFPGKEVELGYNVGTRTNGVDLPYWPKDLSVEVVSKDSV
ncbi:hypothetical protein KCU78_g9762, partial [Aureobasidium melanogenum]